MEPSTVVGFRHGFPSPHARSVKFTTSTRTHRSSPLPSLHLTPRESAPAAPQRYPRRSPFPEPPWPIGGRRSCVAARPNSIAFPSSSAERNANHTDTWLSMRTFRRRTSGVSGPANPRLQRSAAAATLAGAARSCYVPFRRPLSRQVVGQTDTDGRWDRISDLLGGRMLGVWRRGRGGVHEGAPRRQSLLRVPFLRMRLGESSSTLTSSMRSTRLTSLRPRASLSRDRRTSELPGSNT